jgi:hypothetical protein
MLKKYLVLLFCFMPCVLMADDCLDYKLTPKINVIIPDWEKQVVQPLKKMDVLHGNVIATMVDNYEITTDITSIEDGFCIALKQVDATLGYSDFLVQIDISHRPNTCSYDAILSHEDEHIRAYLSVIDDNEKMLKESIFSAANSVVPVFVKNEKDIESGIDKLNNEIQNHPDIILLKQHLKAEEEIRNKRVDENDNGTRLKKCFE